MQRHCASLAGENQGRLYALTLYDPVAWFFNEQQEQPDSKQTLSRSRRCIPSGLVISFIPRFTLLHVQLVTGPTLSNNQPSRRLLYTSREVQIRCDSSLGDALITAVKLSWT